MDDVDAILSDTHISAPHIRLARDGKVLPLDGLRGAGPFGHVGMLDRLFEEYRGGATIILQALQDRWTPLRRLCQSLASEFSAAFQVNVYLTPPGEQGFATHYDTHDVFVLLLEGRKRWRIYDNPRHLPTIGQPPSQSTDGPGELQTEFDLEAGDLLYLPRGWWHDATARDKTSLHLTVGVFPLTWGAVAMHALERVISTDPRFRESLPVGFSERTTASDDARDRWTKLIDTLCIELNRPEFLETAANAARTARQPSLRGHLIDLAALKAIDLDTLFAPRTGTNAIFEKEPDGLRLRFNGKAMTFPPHVEPDLRALIEGGYKTARDLPGGLDEEARLLLVRRLIEEGFLTLRSPPT